MTRTHEKVSLESQCGQAIVCPRKDRRSHDERKAHGGVPVGKADERDPETSSG